MGRDLMKIGRDRVLFALSGADRPAAAVESGATVVFETADCYNGQITGEDILHSAIRQVVNPLKTCRMELPRHIFAAYGGTLPE